MKDRFRSLNLNLLLATELSFCVKSNFLKNEQNVKIVRLRLMRVTDELILLILKELNVTNFPLKVGFFDLY